MGGWLQITCQHGIKECQLNIVEACGIRHISDPSDDMAFVFCVESLAQQQTPDAIIQSCGKDNAASISACYGEGTGADGSALFLNIAQQTESLMSDKAYVPWVLIDGQ